MKISLMIIAIIDKIIIINVVIILYIIFNILKALNK